MIRSMTAQTIPSLRVAWPLLRLLQRRGSPAKAGQRVAFVASSPRIVGYTGRYFAKAAVHPAGCPPASWTHTTRTAPGTSAPNSWRPHPPPPRATRRAGRRGAQFHQQQGLWLMKITYGAVLPFPSRPPSPSWPIRSTGPSSSPASVRSRRTTTGAPRQPRASHQRRSRPVPHDGPRADRMAAAHGVPIHGLPGRRARQRRQPKNVRNRHRRHAADRNQRSR